MLGIVPVDANLPAASPARRAGLAAALALSMLAAAAMPASAGKQSEAGEAADRSLGMAILSAVVDENGELTEDAGIAKFEHSLGSASFRLDFIRGVEGCARIAGIGMPVASPIVIGSATTYGDRDFPNRIYVTTTDAAGNLVPKPFHLVVFCPR